MVARVRALQVDPPHTHKMGGDNGGGKGEGFIGTTTKDTWTKPRGGVESGEACGGWLGCRGSGGGKMQTTVLEQQ